jgi:hypothetical protein
MTRLLTLASVLALAGPAVTAPAPKGEPGPPAVGELFEDDADAFVPLLSLGGEAKDGGGKIAAEATDVFAGKAAVRVSPFQRFHHEIKEWNFRIAEEPKAGEYRYLRFAWKKEGKGPLMLQMCTKLPGRPWFRYYAGKADPPWPAKVLGEAAPADWRVVTRDLYADFGAFDLVGLGLSPLSDGDGLFDHILVGRTVADLNRATAAALKKDKPKPLAAGRLRQLWLDLGSPDPIVADSAVWALVAGREDAMPYLVKTVTMPDKKPTPVDAAKVTPLLEQLGHDRQAIREAATKDLLKLGDGVLPHLRTALAAADGEARARIQAVLDRRDTQAPPDEHRLRRCRTILRAVDTAEARELLDKIEKALP